jgi:DNA-binding LacI/PurR family transcriptional regulator
MSTKTESVRSRVFGAILRGDYGPGDRIPAEREMAETTRTSRVTVRRAYAELEAAGVLERRQGSGARISTSAGGRQRQSGTVAVLASLKDPFAVEFIEAMERALAEQDTFLVLKLTDQDPGKEREAAMALVSQGIRDLVVWASGGGFDRALFGRLRILGTNLVFFDRMLGKPFADYVGLDNRHAVEILLAKALSAGSRSAVFVTHEGLDADSDRQRQEAFERLAAARGIEYRVVGVPWGADLSTEIRSRMGALAKTRPAVVAVNDALAMAVKAAWPRLAVFGIDGLPAAVQAGVTTLRQPMQAMAAAAVRMLGEQQTQGSRWKPRECYLKGALVSSHTKGGG